MLSVGESLTRKPGTILARNSDELDHVEDEKDEADELASLLVFVGVAEWPKHHKGPPPG